MATVQVPNPPAGSKLHRIVVEYASDASELPRTAEPEPAAHARHPGVWMFVGAAVLALVALAALRFRAAFPEVLPLVLGMLGGILHEITQSGGIVHIPRKMSDGDYYLGSVGGAVFGLLAGTTAIMTGLGDGATPAAQALPGLLGFGMKAGADSLASVGTVRNTVLGKP